MYLASRNPRIALFTVLVILLVVVLGLNQSLMPKTHAATSTLYTMTAFTNANESNMYVYQSGDALNYSLLKGPAYTPPSGLVRDPSIMKHSDGKYYIAYTTNWTGNTFGIASSTDKVNWTFIRNVTLSVANLTETWAPEWFKDSNGSVNIIVSLRKSGGSFQPHIMTATNTALSSWTTPSPISGLSSANYIDTFVTKVGSTYHAIVKNETTKYLEYATASSLAGPYTFSGTGNWSGWGNWLEGPAVIQLDNGNYRIYFDAYSEGKYYYSDSANFTSWSAKQEVPGGLSGFIRHMTVLKETVESTIVSGNTYNLVNVASGKALDVWNMGTANGTNVAIYTLYNNAAQKWTIYQNSDGTYKLINPNSGKALDVDGFGTANGTNVQIWQDYNNAAQKWSIIQNADGSYRLINPNSNKALDAAGTSNGSNVLIWDYWGGSNQHWNIVPAN